MKEQENDGVFLEYQEYKMSRNLFNFVIHFMIKWSHCKPLLCLYVTGLQEIFVMSYNKEKSLDYNRCLAN